MLAPVELEALMVYPRIYSYLRIACTCDVQQSWDFSAHRLSLIPREQRKDTLDVFQDLCIECKLDMHIECKEDEQGKLRRNSQCGSWPPPSISGRQNLPLPPWAPTAVDLYTYPDTPPLSLDILIFVSPSTKLQGS